MFIHSVIEKSKVNGPGIRYTIWFQGCSIHCPGCANKHMWEHGQGMHVTPAQLFAEVVNQEGIDGISITGGEPLDQYEDLVEFLELCSTRKIEVFLTSGHTLDEIKERYPKVLELLDILVDGPFMQDKVDNTPAWRGSTNQGIHLLTERAKKYQGYEPEYTTELIFGTDGTMKVTGFTVPKFIKDMGKS